MTPAAVRDRIVRLLERGPLYAGGLELMVGCPGNELRPALRQLVAAGRIERALEIGPHTYRLVEVANPPSGGGASSGN